MKSVNSDSIEVNQSPQDFKTPIDNKILTDNNDDLKNKINHGLFSRIYIHILFFSYLVSKINFNFKFIFFNIPLFTIYRFEFHRLLINPFICESFYELVISIIMISTIINNYENKEGTILFFFKYCYNSIISQIILLFLYYIISFIKPITLTYRINSREFLCIAYLVKHLLMTDNKRILNPYLGELNDRFVIVLFLFMYLFLNMEYRIDTLICLYYGFLICKYKSKNIRKNFKAKIIKLLFIFVLLLFYIFLLLKNNPDSPSFYVQDDVTLVTTLFKLPTPRHKFSDYIPWIEKLLQVNKPIVFFIQKNLSEMIKPKRPKIYDNKTIWIELDFSELYFNKYKKEFEQTYLIDGHKFRHNIFLFIIWSEKLKFLERAITI